MVDIISIYLIIWAVLITSTDSSQSNIDANLFSIQRLNSLSIDTVDQFSSETHYSHFNEVNESYISLNTPSPSSSSRAFIVTADVSKYTSFDEISLCYYASYYHMDSAPRKLILSLPFQDFFIHPKAIPFFVSCCPTIPFIYDINSIPNNSTQLLRVTIPSFTDPGVGCGFSLLESLPPQDDAPSSSSSSYQIISQPLSYPNLLTTEHYRNVRQGDHRGRTVLFTVFSIPFHVLPPETFPSFTLKYTNSPPSYPSRGDSPASLSVPTSIDPSGPIVDADGRTWSRVSCGASRLRQGTEGYHRTLTLNLAQCDSDLAPSMPVNDNNDNGDVHCQCQYSLFWTFPNSVFVDPYQLIDHTIVATRIRKGKVSDNVTTKDDNSINRDGSNTKLHYDLELDQIHFSFYDFIDVEAQKENARGYSFITYLPELTPFASPSASPSRSSPSTQPTQSTQSTQTTVNPGRDGFSLTLSFPIHLRYAVSRVSYFGSIESSSSSPKHAHTTASDVTEVESNRNDHQFRFLSYFQFPVLMKSCGCSSPSEHSTHPSPHQPELFTPSTEVLTRILSPINNVQSAKPTPTDNNNNNNNNNSNNINIHSRPPFSFTPISVSVPVGNLDYLFSVSYLTVFTILAICIRLLYSIVSYLIVINRQETLQIPKPKND